jgi:hypothetical protein
MLDRALLELIHKLLAGEVQVSKRPTELAQGVPDKNMNEHGFLF